jgi:hypothetical protein
MIGPSSGRDDGFRKGSTHPTRCTSRSTAVGISPFDRRSEIRLRRSRWLPDRLAGFPRILGADNFH